MDTYGELVGVKKTKKTEFRLLADVEEGGRRKERGNPAVTKAPNTRRERKWDEWKILLACTIKNKCCFHMT